ncbi:sugar-binding domain-containing protein [Roseimarinus sediminis]|uniref:sugar-binding domain-containing protein n=1 Tax=Roseimarinus sediminis TaxID=1610899 RepID=UPI003D1D3539
MKAHLSSFVLSIILAVLSLNLQGQIATGTSEKINDNWKFSLSDEEGYSQLAFNDEKWRTVNLPHDWSVEHQLSPTLASCQGYLPGGIAWYRKKLQVPATKEGEIIYLYFEGVYNRSKVYFNGHLLGERPNGYVSFMYDATEHVKYGEENVVAVRVDHSRAADSRWYTGSGIYRNVWLLTAQPVHFEQWGIFAYGSEVSEQKATLNIEVSIKNEEKTAIQAELSNTLFDQNGKKVEQTSALIKLAPNSSHTQKMHMSINRPELWGIDHPNLYTLESKLISQGKVLDASTTTTAFRNIQFDPDKGLTLNGENIKLKGVCLHHDAGVLGAAVPELVWKKRLETLKSIGCNAIRTSHNPQATALYELCDRMGFLVMNEAFDEWEFPKRKWLEGWNVGSPGFQGSYDFFEEWSVKDLSDMVLRDRNHPSIFAWSIGNEVDYPNDPYSHPVLDGTAITQPMYGGYKPDAPDANRLGDIAQRLVATVKQYDTSRPVTAALAGVRMSNETEYPGALDIAGYNYTESQYHEDHRKYPERVIYGSENRHDMEAWKMVRDNDFIAGQFLWTGIDYLGEAGRWPSRGLYSGLIDFSGNLKPRGHFRASLWKDEPTIYIGTYPVWGNRNRESIDAWPNWNYDEGRTIKVNCYTNTPKAKLLLNGIEVGEVKDYDDSDGIISWELPFAPGTLTAVGLDENNKELCSFELVSSSRPTAIKAHSEESTISKDRGLAMVRLTIVDKDGNPVFLSDELITCRVEGPGKLLGLEAANNSDMTNYNDNRHRVFHGKMLAYIEATGEAGEINIHFSANWLEDAKVKIVAE